MTVLSESRTRLGNSVTETGYCRRTGIKQFSVLLSPSGPLPDCQSHIPVPVKFDGYFVVRLGDNVGTFNCPQLSG